MASGVGQPFPDLVREIKEAIRWAWAIGHDRLHHHYYPRPIPDDTIRDCGPLRSDLELEFVAVVIARRLHLADSHADILEWTVRQRRRALGQDSPTPGRDLEAIDPGRGGYYADMLSLGDAPGGTTTSPGFFLPTMTRPQRQEHYRLARAARLNCIFFSCYNEGDGHGWAPADLVRPYNLLTQHTRAIELCREIQAEGFHPLMCLKNDDAPALDGVKSDPWRGAQQFRQWAWPFLDAVRPHLSLPLIMFGIEVNEWCTAADHLRFLADLGRQHPGLWNIEHYTRGRDNHGSRTASSYGADACYWDPTTKMVVKPGQGRRVADGASWFRSVNEAIDGRAILGMQPDPLDFDHDLRKMLHRSRGNIWGVRFGLCYAEGPWQGGAPDAQRRANRAHELGVTASLHGRPSGA